MTDSIQVIVDTGEGLFEVRGGTVDDAPGPFISILDPLEYDSLDLLGAFQIDGSEYLLVHEDRVVAIEGDHERLGSLLGDFDD